MQKSVREAKIVYTHDAPEGGFDALLQAMVCGDYIGWRKKKARHIIVVATDNYSHMVSIKTYSFVL